MSSPFHSKRGFTLIEILVVIAILAVLTGISLPVISALNKSGELNRTLAELSGTLEMARQYAVAQNTYVWVTFAAPDPSVAYRLDVAVLASADGTEVSIPGTGSPPGPSTWGGTLSTGTTLNLVSQIKTYPLTKLVDPGAVTPATPLTSPGSPLASTSSFALTLPAAPATTTFTRAIEFTPTGEARVASGTPVNLVEFDIQPYNGAGVVNSKNGAVIQVDGLTGAVHVYRQ